MGIKEYKQKKEAEMTQILFSLIDNWEEEIIEFKEAGKSFKQSEIGQYFSAISNEANLRGHRYGWLIFGVRNKDRHIVGSDYRDTQGLNTLKNEIALNTTGGISFVDIYEVYPVVDDEKKRVIMFQIPAAITAIPTGWHNIEYGRDGESLVPLSAEKRERIRNQEKYKEKMNRPHISEEIDRISDAEFLKKLHLLRDGKVTKAAMILLGKTESAGMFETPPLIMWRLYSADGAVKAYEIFEIPFITVADLILEKIRFVTYRYMPNRRTLFPEETIQYNSWILRELLHNCIAHSNYQLGGRIYVNEFEDHLTITNPGNFIPDSVQAVLEPGYNPPFYRNPLLASAMVDVRMIDTASSGIPTIFRLEKERYFPMPDYDTNHQHQVSVTVYGHIVNERYTHILFDNPSMDLRTVYLIDKVQKKHSISEEELIELQEKQLVRGEPDNLFLIDDIHETVINANETKKQMDNEKETTVSDEKQLFETKKQAFEQLITQYRLSAPTRDNVMRLYEEYRTEGIFSRADIKKVCKITDSPAGTLINKLKKLKLIESVTGNGKGKYRFTVID